MSCWDVALSLSWKRRGSAGMEQWDLPLYPGIFLAFPVPFLAFPVPFLASPAIPCAVPGA